MSRSLSLTLHFHSLLFSIFYPILILIATDLCLLIANHYRDFIVLCPWHHQHSATLFTPNTG